MKRNTIRKYRDFHTLPTDPSAVSECFFVKAKKTRLGLDARYGIIAPKKTFKLAVDRNRAKRLLRDWIAYNENNMLENLDYIFIARSSILDSKRDFGRNEIARTLHHIAKISNSHV